MTAPGRYGHQAATAAHPDQGVRHPDTLAPTYPHAVRTIRARAKRIGLRVVKRGDTIEVWGSGDVPEACGTVHSVAVWLDGRVESKPSGPPPVPVPTAWQRWIDLFVAEQHSAHRSRHTIATRVAHLTAFAHAHPGSDPIDTTRDQLLAWVGDRSRKPRTAHSIRSTMRVFYRLLYDLGHRHDNPAATLPSINLPRSLPRPCPDHAVRHAYGTVTDERLLLAIGIAVETGMRRSEVVRTHPGDVEGREGDYRLHVIGKAGHHRTVPISDELAGRILHHAGYLFAGRDGQPLTPRHLGNLISKALPGEWTTHTLRHRFATLAYQASTDLRAVQDLLGHSSPLTTAIYTKISDDSMRKAAAAAAIRPPAPL